MRAKAVQLYGRGPYTFRVHGQVYHRTSYMHPSDGQDRQFAQLCIIDSEQAKDVRTRNTANVISIPENLENLVNITR